MAEDRGAGTMGHRFSFHVVSAAPEEVIQGALDLSVLVPILEDILGWGPARIRALFESEGLLIHEWDKVRTDRVTIREPGQATA